MRKFPELVVGSASHSPQQKVQIPHSAWADIHLHCGGVHLLWVGMALTCYVQLAESFHGSMLAIERMIKP